MEQSNLHTVTNRRSLTNSKPYITKSLAFLSLLLLIGFNNFYLTTKNTQKCLYDKATESLLNVTIFYTKNVPIRDTLVMLSSLFLDTLAILVFILWVWKGKSWRLTITALLYYGLRAFIQNTYQMPFTNYFELKYPNFPSLVVSYAKSSDFFYSGHVGMPLIVGNEFKRNGHTNIYLFTIFVSIYEGFVMTSTNAHYGIDCIMGWIVVGYLSIIVDGFIEKVDDSIISIDTEKYISNKESNNKSIKW